MKPYRKNVGIIIFNSSGEVLVGERLNYPGSWQFPQGGVDEGEELLESAKRELYEEVGIDNAKFIYEAEDWLFYDFPENLKLKLTDKYRGQSQKWFLFYWNYDSSFCNLKIHEQEFERVKFIPLKEIIHTIVDFKKDVYTKLILIFEPKIKEFLEIQKNG